MVANLRTVLCGVFATFLVAISAAQVADPADLLRRSMGPNFPSNVVAILSQRDPDSDSRQLIKLQRDKTGRSRKSVLQPLRKQGNESIDDGERFVTYLPDEKLMVDQESTLRSSGDSGFRMALVRRNYVLNIDSKPTIAGRKCMRVVAQPKFADLDVRRYYLDAANGFPLKMETVSRQGAKTVHFEVLDIKYPETLNASTFTIRTPVGMKVLKYQRPLSVATIATAREDLPFAPIVPDELPMGFRVREIQVNKGQWSSLAIHLTDGLSRATIYEWRADTATGEVKTLEGRSVKDAGPVRILCVSDLTTKVREKLLAAFNAQLQRIYAEPGFQGSLRRITSQNLVIATPREPMTPMDSPESRICMVWRAGTAESLSVA